MTVTVGNDDSWYYYQLIENREGSATYTFNGEFQNAVGVTLLAPFEGNLSYSL